ncbi:hypothetical protein DFJ58DRAFT_847510 [Suillus subalutaceus]|uniref:uncharacterized protein n=1 Tax=Suillus subalutaceus TaxID=48586 RepID=UPI001B86FEA6|nr:uncharacterized protein DFJ58DRAFT_847510 [Suillus subalutaceus]KAG1834952.1 hypothetical protein DFJ58DRAFT_847510 [Suillus subalutaceus]
MHYIFREPGVCHLTLEADLSDVNGTPLVSQLIKENNPEFAKEIREKAESKGEELPDEKAFDSNYITPGAPFTVRLSRAAMILLSTRRLPKILIGVACKLYYPVMKHRVKVNTRSWNTFDHREPDYNPNVRHCLYGPDADLIMLSPLSHDPHFCLLREQVKFGPAAKRKGNVSLERVIDDFILLAVFVGNDFLPNLPDLHIHENGPERLFDAYKKVFPSLVLTRFQRDISIKYSSLSCKNRQSTELQHWVTSVLLLIQRLTSGRTTSPGMQTFQLYLLNVKHATTPRIRYPRVQTSRLSLSSHGYLAAPDVELLGPSSRSQRFHCEIVEAPLDLTLGDWDWLTAAPNSETVWSTAHRQHEIQQTNDLGLSASTYIDFGTGLNSEVALDLTINVFSRRPFQYLQLFPQAHFAWGKWLATQILYSGARLMEADFGALTELGSVDSAVMSRIYFIKARVMTHSVSSETQPFVNKACLLYWESIMRRRRAKC